MWNGVKTGVVLIGVDLLLLALLSSSWITGCTRIAPGYVGIKVSAQSAPNISGMSIDQFPEIECEKSTTTAFGGGS